MRHENKPNETKKEKAQTITHTMQVDAVSMVKTKINKIQIRNQALLRHETIFKFSNIHNDSVFMPM